LASAVAMSQEIGGSFVCRPREERECDFIPEQQPKLEA
jgi:hypothetical protein